MATLFKPTRPYPLPAGAEVVDKDGRPHARVREKGRAVLYPLSEDRTKYLKPAAKWAADVRLADGTRKRVRFSPNRDAAALMLAELLKRIESEKSGLRDTFADHRKCLVADLLGEYEQFHRDRGNSDRQASQVRAQCEKVVTGCGGLRLGDLDSVAAQAEGWLAARRQLPRKAGGISAQTFNHYIAALKAFGNWLAGRARRVTQNPFRHLTKVNVEVDIRHARRPLVPDEFSRLLAAAATGRSFRGLGGADRRVLYLVAGYTGLRASELASLTPGSFALDADPPTVTVAAAYSKHKREDVVPLHPDLVGHLRPWLAGRPADGLLWPGKWAKQFTAAAMLRRDLDAARVAWVAEVAGTARADRERSDFLAYKDRDGGTADFHALRHTFITSLVNAGVLPKDAKELARHSTITLTMDRYTHVTMKDTAAAVAKLPSIGPVGDSGAATGAAASGNGRGQERTDEDTRTGDTPPTVRGPRNAEPLPEQGFEGDRGLSGTDSPAEREGFEATRRMFR